MKHINLLITICIIAFAILLKDTYTSITKTEMALGVACAIAWLLEIKERFNPKKN